MRKMRLILILTVVVMLSVMVLGCDKKTTKPSATPAKMILVPGGSFTMGDATGEGFSDERPTHTVTLNSFFIGKYEVTQAEFSKYMQPDHPWEAHFGRGDNFPAYNVSWYSIIKYCNLRSMAEKLTPCYTINRSTDPADWGPVPTDDNNPTWDAVTCDFSANGYRLPTEAEWEYAARARTNDPDYLYSGSNDIEAVAWYYDEEDDDDDLSNWGSHPVGKKAPNGLGIYDMSGNLEEWCWDWYDWDYYEVSPQNNPTGPTTGDSRVIRGGSWGDDPEFCRVPFRWDDYPYDFGYYTVGFRLCRSNVD